MEVEMLIAAVRGRRPIWDASLKLHSNRDHMKKLWDEISNELGIDCGVAKKKWRALRENYRKEQSKKRSTTGQAAGDNWKSRWTHYDELSFLQDQFVPRLTSGSMGPGLNLSEDATQFPEDQVTTNDGPQDTSIVSENDEVEMAADEPVIEPSLPGTSTASNVTSAEYEKKKKLHPTPTKRTSPMKQRPKEFKKRMLQKMVMLEEKKVEEYLKRKPSSSQAAQEVQDADFHFLMSLLPSLRAIPAHRKLLLRRKIEDVFLEEQGYNNEMNMFGYNFTTLRTSSAGSCEAVLASPGGQSDGNSIVEPTSAGYQEHTLHQLISGYGQCE